MPGFLVFFGWVCFCGFFFASGLGPAKHLYSRRLLSAFLSHSSTTPLSFLIVSPAHLFRVFFLYGEKEHLIPACWARYMGRPFFPVENQEACVEENGLLWLESRQQTRGQRLSGQSFSRELLQATDPLWCCSWFTVSPGTSVCAAALVRVNSNQATFYSIHNLFLGLHLLLTHCRIARNAHPSQHRYRNGAPSSPALELPAGRKQSVAPEILNFTFPWWKQKRCPTNALPYSACAGSVSLGLVSGACVEQRVSIMMGDVVGIGSFLSKSAKTGLWLTLVLYFFFSF